MGSKTTVVVKTTRRKRGKKDKRPRSPLKNQKAIEGTRRNKNKAWEHHIANHPNDKQAFEQIVEARKNLK